MTRRILSCSICLLAVCLALPVPGEAADFRLYTANKLLQQREVSMVRNTDKPGCHNLITKRRIYRVAQIGFEACSVYTESDCEAGTEIEVSWKNKKTPTTTFTRGARWYLPGERGSKMKSWKCEGES